jgi:hypothetical protein
MSREIADSMFLFKSYSLLVAQSCTLPYRRFVIGRTSTRSSTLELPTPCRRQFCDTAERNSALRGESPLVKLTRHALLETLAATMTMCNLIKTALLSLSSGARPSWPQQQRFVMRLHTDPTRFETSRPLRPGWPRATLIRYALLCTFFTCRMVLGATVTLQPVADTSLFENSPDNNLGAADLAAGTIRIGSKSRALVRFDLVGKVPGDATITSVEMTFRVSKTPPAFSAVASTFGLHRILRSWGEGLKGGTVGSPASAGEANWNARSFPDVLWNAPGAAAPLDYSTTASGTTPISGPGPYTFASAPGLVADVQAWLANPGANFGWILISQSEDIPFTARRFASREDPSNGPSLIIQYSAPAQATAPAITAQPQSQTAIPGWDVSFSVTATGTAPLSYQWKFNGNDIAGATSSTLTLPNTQPANAGTYIVVVSNSAGSVTSTGATLSMLVPPTITQQPQSQTVHAGATATFNVAAAGSEPLRYQWKFNGNDLTGASAAILTLSNVQPANAGNYSVVVSNAASAITSSTATLIVLVPPSITQQPQSQTVNAGTNVTLAVSVAGTEPFSFQWKFNGSDIAGATSASLVLTNIQPANGGTYIVNVANAAGSVTSAGAALTVSSEPETPPQIERIERNGNTVNILFTVAASFQLALEHADSLPATTWTTLTNVSAKLAPVTVTVPDSISASSNRFYRLKVTGRIR